MKIQTLTLLAVLVVSSFAAWSQTQPPAAKAVPPAVFAPELRAQLQALREAALSSDYAWRQLAHLT